MVISGWKLQWKHFQLLRFSWMPWVFVTKYYIGLLMKKSFGWKFEGQNRDNFKLDVAVSIHIFVHHLFLVIFYQLFYPPTPPRICYSFARDRWLINMSFYHITDTIVGLIATGYSSTQFRLAGCVNKIHTVRVWEARSWYSSDRND